MPSIEIELVGGKRDGERMSIPDRLAHAYPTVMTFTGGSYVYDPEASTEERWLYRWQASLARR